MPGVFGNSVQDSVQTLQSTTTAVALGSNGFTGRFQMSVFNAAGSNGATLFIGGPNTTVASGTAVASNAQWGPYAAQPGSIYGVGLTNVRIIEWS
jgi:hypothetical protein